MWGRNLLLLAGLIIFALLASAYVFYRVVAVPRTEASVAYMIQLAGALGQGGAARPPAGVDGPARVLAPPAAPPPFDVPARRSTLAVLKEIGSKLPDGGQIGWQEDPPTAWIGVPGATGTTWVGFPARAMLPRLRGVVVAWAMCAGLLALAGAFFIQRRIDRPLRALVGAAQDIGAGRSAPALDESGPQEIAQLARAFNAMALDLDAHERERALMLAGVSHDLRSPLTKIRLALEMLGPAADATLRASIERSVDSANRVIDQFVDFGRGGGEEAVQRTDLNALVQAAVEEQALQGVTVEAGAIPLVDLRPLAVRRLLANLIDNAVKYAGLPVKVRTHAEATEVVLSVADEGPGITNEEAARLRKPFVRASRSRADVPGAGLGLAIVERIARAHQAQLELRAAHPGSNRPGLEVRVAFPRAAAALEQSRAS
jgi:two-component system osmolarity sensor histidine kinase EnvZ